VIHAKAAEFSRQARRKHAGHKIAETCNAERALTGRLRDAAQIKVNQNIHAEGVIVTVRFYCRIPGKSFCDRWERFI
jgi:hypothetical protein